MLAQRSPRRPGLALTSPVMAARPDSAGRTMARTGLDRATIQDIIEWDVRNWSMALRFWQQHSALDLSGCRALELGSRGGGLSLWLALQGAHVVCSDVADPDEAAVRKHERYGVSHLITYQRVDASEIPFVDHFDVILFKSVLGAVGRGGRPDRQLEAIGQIHKALRPGGELYFAENLTGSWLHVLLRRQLVKWGRSWRYLSLDEVQGLMSRFSEVTYDTGGFLGALGRTERQRAALGAVDDLVMNAITPAGSRYIVAGVARK